MEADVPRSAAMTPEERRSPRPAGEPSDTSSLSDAESIVGKIVYNPDGSAVLLEGESEASDEEPELPPASSSSAASAQGFLLNAFHITRNSAALYSALYGQLLQEKSKVPDVPVMHSYRVFTVRDKKQQQAVGEEESTPASKEAQNSEPGKRPQSMEKENFPILDFCPVPVKPVLMCFLCKLSFSYSKSFVAHAMGEHNITLVEEEKDYLSRKNCSAIIQGVGKDKEPLLSFLEPIPSSIYGGDQKMPTRIFTQNSSSSSSSLSLGTTFNSPVSSAVSRSNSGSSAITTLVSATTSPVSSLPELKGDFNSLLAGPSLVGNSELNEVLAPELEDLATIEKLAKAAAAAAAEANDSSPRPLYSPKNDKSRGSSATPSGEPSSTEQETKPLPPHFSNNLQLDRPPSRESASPRTSPKANFTIPSPLNSSCQSPTPTTSSPIGICPLHPDGRPNGVECTKCDLVLMASRTLGGHMSMLHSRNSCKTLKCPKCNWHYKYQETLEIHMKEKHPENEMSCIYCLANQPHPRLARGETYTCGYKPYRCEVCNYSTTTKGNLSIHMQSDKHINNVQELQNGNIPHELLQQQQQQAQQQVQQQTLPTAPTLPDTVKKPPPPPPPTSSKPKATWRCDVCNYETNVARNLRIHMTSEKHTHNMMVLQQNVKHMQQLTAFQQSQSMDPLYQFHPGLLLPCDTQLQPEAALADMAYNHALLMMATQQQQHQHQQQQQQRAMAAAMAAASKGLGTNFLTHHEIESEASSRTEFPGDDYSNLFQCCICYVFSSDSLDALSLHVQQDRTRQREDEVLMAVAGNYICKLCTYKTNLKANFQLHCKTDKHLQRLQHFNHVKEGGPMAEWRLKYVNVSNPVQVRCNCCDYYTNSIHKLQMHMSTPRHEASCKLFLHLQMKENSFKADTKYFKCKLCNFNTRTKFNLIQHVHSLRHLQSENMRQMKDPDDTGDIFLVKEYNAKDKIPFDVDVDPSVVEAAQRSSEESAKSSECGAAPMLKQALETSKPVDDDVEEVHSCSFCNFTCGSEAKLAEHAASQHHQRRPLLSCPLCQDGFNDWKKLEAHVLDIHHVNKEGVQKILSMVDQKDWISAQNEKKNCQAAAAATPAASKEPEQTPVPSSQQQPLVEHMEEGEKQTEEATKVTATQDDSLESAADENCCPNCGALFNTIDELFSHQNEMGHLSLKQTPRGLGYLCWKKGCQQYFQNVVALQNHFRDVHAQSPPLSVSERHVYKYRCNQCSLAFKTMEKLQLHSQYHVIRAATQCVLCGRSFRSVSSLQKHVETSHTDMTKEEMEQYRSSLVNNPLLVGGSAGVLDPQTTELLKKESNRDDAESLEERIDTSEEVEDCAHEVEGEDQTLGECNKESDSLEDFINSQAVAEDSYNDPNRKYKCHRCRLAFTRQSYLTSHNKTLLHRKGEKMSYPMEKYLDPNRPFKCEICMESFTQKNILLVHYNSVSHLHKLKQSMKEKEKENNSSTGNTTATSSATVPTLTTSIIISTSSSINKNDNNYISTTVSTSSSEADKKPYKCNICKVAYSQGSTLDIHTRSVLHQTKASKLHELAITGQIDLSISLIERPDPNQDQADTSETPSSSSQNVPQASQVIGSSVPSPQVSEQVPGNTSASVTSASPILQVPSDISSSLQHSLGLVPPNPVQVVPQTTVSCQRCSAIFVSQEALLQHQQICCLFSQPPLINRSSAGSTVNANTITNSPFSQTSARQEDFLSLSYPPQLDISSTKFPHFPSQLSPQFAQQLRAKCSLPRTRPLVYKHLLEGFGFDVVMQFNEFNQKYKKRDHAKDPDADSSSKCAKPNDAVVVKKEESDNKEEVSKCNNLPEINRSVCCLCQKEFSSIWVLKAHREEIHKEIVPVDNVEKLGEDFRVDYEKRNPVQASSPGGHQDDLAYDTSSSSPSALADQNLCSTPTSSISSSLSLPMSMATSMTPPITSFSSQNADVSTVSASQMAAQLQFNLLMMNMGHSMGLPMGMNMSYPAAAAAAMNLHPNLLPLIMAPPPLNPLMASAFNHSMVPGSVDPSFFAAQQQLLQQQSLAQAQQKRARTRISDDQLKILRTYFDINNSPTEEQLIEMSEKSGLPLKVIKHWFRNTLFKERQRNKDSPYNFNNPPSTFLNLEEYEKTGETKVISTQNGTAISEASGSNHQSVQNAYDMSSRLSSADETDSSQEGKFKMDAGTHYINSEDEGNEKSHLEFNLVPSSAESNMAQLIPSSTATSLHLPTSMESVVRSLESSPNSQPPLALVSSSALAMPPLPYPPTSDSPMLGSAYNTCHSSGKRANRTRFTDYQIKVLQEFFESNAYPKDDDLEYLSKLLNLSPRVIVVWFQNARQKARKVYENQPPVTPEEENSGRFQRTPGLNYQCKKCLQVFQRYYELIKHQKNSCFKDENPLSVQIKNIPNNTETKAAAPPAPPTVPNSNSTTPTASTVPEKIGQNGTFRCDKCGLVFSRYDLWREHQIVHIMNPNLFPNFPPNSSFGILQYEGQQSPPQAIKRKLSEDEDTKEMSDQPRDKRLRTTILPEQLDYLYQKYQIESNPSRKMLENIAREVGLKKRVVQVWFQNTRARERKGQFRAHQQVIHKRCPFCRALFKARSALESHLATRHADQYTKGDIIIDALPDGDTDSNPETPNTTISEDTKSNPTFPSSIPPPSLSPNNQINFSNCNEAMKKYYEDSLKKYFNDLSGGGQTKESSGDTASKPVKSATGEKGEIPLDLSKSVKMGFDGDSFLASFGDKSLDDLNRSFISEDARSETYSESTDNMEGDESNPTSPSPSLQSVKSQSQQQHRSYYGAGKRYRTQMTTFQVKVMKSIFVDYKTPSMSECEMLGREIGLQKRVIQVWFQNARAKEKKSKLAFVKTFGQELEVTKPPDKCKICNIQYDAKFSNTLMQDHIFSKGHIANLRIHIEKMKKLAEGQDDRTDGNSSTSQADPPNLMQQLQMMGFQQMAGLGLPSGFNNNNNNPAPSLVKEEKTSASPVESDKKDDKKKDSPHGMQDFSTGDAASGLFPYMYAAGYPGGYFPGPFFHPPMYQGNNQGSNNSSGGNQMPGNGNQMAGGVNQMAGNGNQMPGGVNQMAGNGNQMPGGVNQMAGNVNQMPGGVNQMPGGMTQMPGAVNQMQGSLNQIPGGMNQMPGNVNQMLGNVNQMSGGMNQMPGGVGQMSGGMGQMTGGVNHMPGDGMNNSMSNLQMGNGMNHQMSPDCVQMQSGQMTGGVNQMPGGMNQMPGNMNQMPGNMNQMSGNMNQMSGNMNQMSGHMNQMSGSMNQMSGSMNQMSGSMNQMSGSMDQMSGGRMMAGGANHQMGDQQLADCSSQLEAECSAPLSMFQLPPSAQAEVLRRQGGGTVRYWQDGRPLAELRGTMPESDWQQAAEVETEVGHVCSACRTVFPTANQCGSHQRACGAHEPSVRLVALHAECRACRERFATGLEFKFHCATERHVARRGPLPPPPAILGGQASAAPATLQHPTVSPVTSVTRRLLPPEEPPLPPSEHLSELPSSLTTKAGARFPAVASDA